MCRSQPTPHAMSEANVMAIGKPKQRITHWRSAYLVNEVLARYQLSKDSDMTEPDGVDWLGTAL
jgi:hypothetical protein